MKIFTKSLFALALIAATPVLADDNNNPAQVFDRNASAQQSVLASSGHDTAAKTGTATAMFDTAYRADSGR
jgi:hypothetical protein